MRTGFHQTIQSRTVALTARGSVMPRSVLPAEIIVRIVTGCAGQRAIAFSKALRLPEPVDRSGDLEFIIVPGAGRMIEMQNEIAERFPGPIRK